MLFYHLCCLCFIVFSYVINIVFFFFFSSRRRHTRCLSDWSSDVCSSDLVLVVAGILLVRGLGDADRRGIAFGLAIASCIAVYTLVDKGGVAHAEPITYLELSMLAPAVIYAAAVMRVKGVGALRRAVGWESILAGVCTFGAYALVLAALQRAPAAPVAAVRETSVVIAALLAAFVLKEKVT